MGNRQAPKPSSRQMQPLRFASPNAPKALKFFILFEEGTAASLLNGCGFFYPTN
jgi:hypothetical protein